MTDPYVLHQASCGREAVPPLVQGMSLLPTHLQILAAIVANLQQHVQADGPTLLAVVAKAAMAEAQCHQETYSCHCLIFRDSFN